MYGATDPAAAEYYTTPADSPAVADQRDRTQLPRPRASWRQVGRDLLFLWPGLPICIASFTLLVTGFWLGVGLIPLAFLGFVVLLVTLMTARAFAAAERARVSLMEDRPIGPAYYRNPTTSGMSRIFSYLRDPQLWRDFLHGVLILFVRIFTWSMTVTWTAGSLMVTYFIWGWSIPDGEVNGLSGLIFGWDSRASDIAVNTILSLFFIATLPYVIRGVALVESSLAWGLLTNENAAWRARAEELTRSRHAVVQAEANTLRRVERDIHDGPQQRLVRLTMDLQSAQRRLNDDPDAARPLVDEALQQTQEALAELRALSRGIAPPILTDRGLSAALAAAAGRCPVPTTLDVQLGTHQRLPAAVENAAYFVVTETLTNVAKHSGATSCEVSVFIASNLLCIRVADNGRGGAHIGKGHGLAGLADRLAGVDGQLALESPYGGGTIIGADIPIVS